MSRTVNRIGNAGVGKPVGSRWGSSSKVPLGGTHHPNQVRGFVIASKGKPSGSAMIEPRALGVPADDRMASVKIAT